MEKLTKARLDVLLTNSGLADSREKARALIMAGKVSVEDQVVDKPGREFPLDAALKVAPSNPYVSRGGIKLAAALDAFRIQPTGLTILDAGASTGGFTHCLLLRGASKVIAIDVGYGQFHWSLRNDPRVHLIERKNIRKIDPEQLPGPIHAAVADLSFISLELALPKLKAIVQPKGWLVTLVKPQFEVGRGDVGKKGVVRDPKKIRGAIDRIKNFAQSSGFRVLGEIESPITGPKGNREFLLHLIAEPEK